MEAAMKLARQYFLELPTPEPLRTKFIARKESYHGNTLGALSMGGHLGRRALFEPMLMSNITWVSACSAYRGMLEGETEDQYVGRLAKELDDEFQRVEPEKVCAFVAEPVVGAVSSLQSFSKEPLTKLKGSWLCARREGLSQSNAGCLFEVRRFTDSRRDYVRHGSMWHAACMATRWRRAGHSDDRQRSGRRLRCSRGTANPEAGR
jgi:Aminotransferase class-III